MKIAQLVLLACAWLCVSLSAQSARLINIATRGQVGTGADILIGGFVITGASKTVLVRAVGPGLAAFGVPGALSAPLLEIIDSKGTTVATNSGWNNTDSATMNAVGAFPLTPGSKDSAVVATLPPGAYSAKVSGLGVANTGVAILEVYDVSGGGQLANIATRLQVGTGANAAFAGFVVAPGNGARRLLIRGIGPALGAFGVPGTLPDPKLTLLDSAQNVIASATADGGASAFSTATVQAGAFASSSNDAVLLVSLPPGSYTSQLGGSSGTTAGVGLVEVYDITSAGTPSNAGYSFQGLIPEAVLRNYLAHSIHMHNHDTWSQYAAGSLSNQQYLDNLRMIRNVGAKFIARVSGYWWSKTATMDATQCLSWAATAASDLHKQDPECLLQACIFETVSPDANNVPIPAWVFDEFGLPRETRNFRYQDIAYPDLRSYVGTAETSPDITRIEAKMWYYFWARSYIDLGYENIDLGQIGHITKNDRPSFANAFELAGRIRAYGAKNARRHLTLLDAMVSPMINGQENFNGVSGIADANGNLLFDFHNDGIRPKENTNSPMDCTLAFYKDTIFGRSLGGRTPSGWSCAHLPVSLQIDYGGEPSPGNAIGYPWAWGWDELGWFVAQPEGYRHDWLRYAWNWIRANDADCYLQMPGLSTIMGAIPGIDWYHANTNWYVPKTQSDLTNQRWFLGFNDEPTAREILSASGDPVVLHGTFLRPTLSSTRTIYVQPEVPSWTFSDTAGVVATGAVLLGGMDLGARSQVGFLRNQSSLSQALSFPGGKRYVVKFSAAQRANATKVDAQVIRVSLDGVTIGTARPVSGAFAGQSFDLGVPEQGTHTLRFEGSSPADGDGVALLTDVSIVSF